MLVFYTHVQCHSTHLIYVPVPCCFCRRQLGHIHVANFNSTPDTSIWVFISNSNLMIGQIFSIDKSCKCYRINWDSKIQWSMLFRFRAFVQISRKLPNQDIFTFNSWYDGTDPSYYLGLGVIKLTMIYKVPWCLMFLLSNIKYVDSVTCDKEKFPILK